MPAKKKDTKKEVKEEVKEEVKQKEQSDQDVANTNAIGSLTQETTSHNDRLGRLERVMERMMNDLNKVLNRLGL